MEFAAENRAKAKLQSKRRKKRLEHARMQNTASLVKRKARVKGGATTATAATDAGLRALLQ